MPFIPVLHSRQLISAHHQTFIPVIRCTQPMISLQSLRPLCDGVVAELEQLRRVEDNQENTCEVKPDHTRSFDILTKLVNANLASYSITHCDSNRWRRSRQRGLCHVSPYLTAPNYPPL